MPESFFSKAKADGAVIAKTVNLLTQLSKLKLAIRSRRQEKERLLKNVGVHVFRMFQKDKQTSGQQVLDEVGEDLREAQAIDREISELEAEIEQVKADFRSASGGKEPPAE